MAISTRSKNTKKNRKINQTRFGPGSSTGSVISTDLNMGLAKIDSRISVRIWLLLLKTDLDPDAFGSSLDSTRCHPYFQFTISLLLSFPRPK